MTRLIGQPLDRGSARGASGIRAGQHRGEDRTRAHREVAVAIAVGPAPSGIYALKDEAPGSYRGVTIDLATALAKKAGVPIEYIPYRGSGEIQATATAGVWDVTFMPVDDERRKVLDFGSPYVSPDGARRPFGTKCETRCG